ncbi:MAG: hypothetical protein ACREPI_01890 [Candidatus Dormibacterales bacterium]
MTGGEFAGELTRETARLLPEGLRAFRHRRQGRLVKIHYGAPEVHFEAWPHARTGRVEVGLHLEGTAALNRRGFELLRSRMVEIKGALPEAELEPWDRGWCRLYQTLPAPALDAEVARRTAALMARYVEALQPLVAEILSGAGPAGRGGDA